MTYNVSSGTLNSTIPMYLFLTVLEIFNVNLRHALEIWVRGRSTSLKMAPFDRPCTIVYQSVSVSISLYCTIFELFDIEEYRNLEIQVKGHSSSLEMTPFDRSHAGFYLSSIVTMAISCIISEIKRNNGRKSRTAVRGDSVKKFRPTQNSVIKVDHSLFSVTV